MAVETVSCSHESAFSLEASPTVFGSGALAELGDHAAALGLGRVALMTDPVLTRSAHVDIARRSLHAAGIDAHAVGRDLHPRLGVDDALHADDDLQWRSSFMIVSTVSDAK